MRELHVPESLLERAETLAEENRVSLEHWVSAALAEKIAEAEAAPGLFMRRRTGANKRSRGSNETAHGFSADPCNAQSKSRFVQ